MQVFAAGYGHLWQAVAVTKQVGNSSNCVIEMLLVVTIPWDGEADEIQYPFPLLFALAVPLESKRPQLATPDAIATQQFNGKTNTTELTQTHVTPHEESVHVQIYRVPARGQ